MSEPNIPPKKFKIRLISAEAKTETNATKGVFIHWGIYSVPAFSPRRKTVPKTGVYNGSEWYLGRLKNTFLYKYDTRDFHAQHYGPFENAKKAIDKYYSFIEEFEKRAQNWFTGGAADLVAKLKQTGAQYVIITAKHHDGVSLYPSKYGTYHTKGDYIGELQKATKAAGLQFGIYYSLMEWTEQYSTGAKKIANYVDKVMQPQLLELITRYQPDILWADGHWQHATATWKSIELLDKLFSIMPNLITNDRWGKDFHDIVNAMPVDRKSLYKSRCYRTGEDRLMCDKADGLWEHVNTISNSWGYAENQIPSDYKSADAIMALYDKVQKAGGRFTINIGLRPDGSMDPLEEVTRSSLVMGLNA